jgi:hypothetical protein
VTTLALVADVVAFLASDLADGMTGTITNVTSGMIPTSRGVCFHQCVIQEVVGALLDVTQLYPNGTLAAPSTQKGFQPNKNEKQQ